MPVDPQQVQVDADFITSQPGWSDPEKRRDFIRDVAVKSRSQVDPELHGAVITELWNRADDRGILQKGAEFTGRALEEVVKSMPATGGAVMFAGNDLIQGTPLASGHEAPDTGSIERFKRGLVNLWDTSGQRLKQVMPGESNQASRDKSLNALKADIDNNLHPQGLESWLAGDFDDGGQKPDAETQEWLDLLSSGIAKKAVAADYMGEVDPEKVRAWMETDRNPLRADSDIPGQPGPREFLADYVATRDPSSWEAFMARVTETDAQHTTRLRRWVAEQKSRPVVESMPEGLGKEMVSRSMDMQTSPIDLATAVLPLLRGAKALQAAKAGGLLAASGRVGTGGLKEAGQEGLTAYLDDARNTSAQVLEAAAMGAVGSTVLEGGMATTGAIMEKLTRPEQQPTPGVQQNPESLQQPVSVPNSMASIAARAGSQPVQWQTTRQPILTDVPDGPPTLTVPSPGKESLRPVQTVPESPETLQEQLARTAEGLKPATFIPAQSSSNVSVPEGLVSTPVTSPETGVMVHRPELDPAAIHQASQDAPGQLMGMGIPTKPADADRAIVLRRADGTPVLDVASNADTEPQVREALQKMAKEGDTITVESPESVIQERQGLPRTAPRVGEIVNVEGYTGRLIQDGSRFAVQVPNGPLVEVPSLSSVTRNTDPKATQAQGLYELEQQAQTTEVKEAGFQAHPDGSLSIQDGAGNTYVPHNPQLLRSVRTGPNGLEVLVRDPRKPGQVIKLTGNQAQNAQEALLNAAQNVEAKGGKVNWGRSRFQFSTLGTIWSKLKSTTAAPLRFLQTDRAGLIDYARRTLEAGPQTIQAPDGRTIALVHNKQGTKGTLFEHLTTESNGRPSPERAAWVPRIATTLKNAAARIQDGKNMIYIARYSERGGRRDVHFVVVSPEGFVTDQGPLDALTTHWARNEARPNQKPRSTEQLLSHFEDLEALQFSLGKKNAVKPTVSDSDPTTGTRANISAQSTRTPGYTVWVNPESGLTESQVRDLLASPPTLGQLLQGNTQKLAKVAAEAVRLLNSHLPGLITPKVRIFATPEEFFSSGHIDPSKLDEESLGQIMNAEGFHDRNTGETVVIASNVNIRGKETARMAIARVILHERVGHEGINVLLDSDPDFRTRWESLSAQIPQSELQAIAVQPGYEDIATDKAQLALEWLARKAELGAEYLEQGLARRFWTALREWVKKALAGFAGKPDFDAEITDLLTLSRRAFMHGTSDPATITGLVQRLTTPQFSMGGTRVFHPRGQPYRVNDRATRAILTGTTLPRVFVETVAATERERRALDQTAAQLGSDLDAAVQSYAERSGRSQADIYELVNQALSGAPGTNAVLMQADPALHTRALRARTFLDDLSQAIANTLPVGELRNTIVLNQGAWMKRSYAAFDPGSGWNYDTVMQAAREGRELGGRPAHQIVNNAFRYLSQRNPQASRAEIEADMRDLMDRDSWTGYLTGKAAIRKDVSSLMARQSLPPEIRFLMGEESNPIKRLAQSASFQSQFLHRHQQQTALRAIGLSNGLFQSQRGGVYTQEIPHDNPRWSPLAGIWTTPQLWQAMQEMDGLNSGNDLWSKAGEALKFLGNEAKFNRVAANPDSWLVNALGNVVALVQTGDLFYSSFFRRVGEAVGLYRSGRSKPGDIVNTALEAVTDAERALLARLTTSGVIGENFTLRDLEASIPRHLLQWVEQDGLRDRVLGAVKAGWWGQSAGRGFGPVGRVIGGIVGAATGGTVGYHGLQNVQQTLATYVMTGPDAIGRLTGFIGNYETALSAGMTPDQAFAHASDRTRNTFPDYGRMPEILKTLSRYGVAGSFIGFQYEVYRNTIWNLRYAMQDLRSGNAALVRKGIARSIGAASVGTLAAGGLQAIFQGLAGTDDERNKKWRKWFAAPWEKNGVLVFTDYTPEGVSYFNTSYLVPQATMMELVNAAKSGEDPFDAAGRVAGHVWEQFMGSSVHLAPIVSGFTNTDRMGRPLTNKDGIEGIWERFDEAQKPILEPGWAQKFERLEYALREAERRGRTFSVEEEMKRLFGIREFTRTWPDMVKRGYDNLAAQNTAIRAQANKILGENLPGAQVKAITEANKVIQDLASELQTYEADLRSLGVPENVIRKARKESSVPHKLSPLEVDSDAKNRVKSSR